MEFDWQQPKNNKIFEQLTADSLKDPKELCNDPDPGWQSDRVQNGTDRNLGYLYSKEEWAEANGTTRMPYDGYLAFQTQNKVFMYNCTGDKVYDNCWDFVAEGVHALFMDIDSEVVGKNFLYMLTRDDYSRSYVKGGLQGLTR